MKDMKHTICTLACLAIGVGVAFSGAHAETTIKSPPGIKISKDAMPLPSYEVIPGSNQVIEVRKGKIDLVIVNENKLVVGDLSYAVDKHTPVTRSGLPLTLKKLKKGMNVEMVFLNGALQEIRVTK